MNYIVAAKGGLYCFYYRDGGIWFCEFKDSVWSKTQMMIPRVRKRFSVNLIDSGEPFLIWQDDDGNLNKGRFSNGDVASDILIAGREQLGQYCAMAAEDGMNLVYSIPFSADVHMLMSQFVGSNGAWGAVRRIDNIGAMAGCLFRLVPIAGNHFLAVYQNSGFESRLGYKEIYGNEVGKYNLIHSSIHSFGDCSFLATTHDLHVACIVRGVFGSRLIYKKKEADGFSPGVVVAEGQGLHNVVSYVVDEKPHLLFMRNDKLYCVGTEDDGYRWSFLPLGEPKKTQPEPKSLSKAVFLSNNMNRKKFLTNDLLVDEEKPWEIQIFLKHILASYEKSVGFKARENHEEPEDSYNNFFNNMEGELAEFMNDYF